MVVSSSLPCKGVLKDVLMWASRVKNWVEVGMGCLWMSCFGSNNNNKQMSRQQP